MYSVREVGPPDLLASARMERIGPELPTGERRVYGNSGQTRKSQSSTAPVTAPAAFQSGQLNRWLAAELCGEHADTEGTELQEDPALPEDSVRPGSVFQSEKYATRLLPVALAQPLIKRPMCQQSILRFTSHAKPLAKRFRQAGISANSATLRYTVGRNVGRHEELHSVNRRILESRGSQSAGRGIANRDHPFGCRAGKPSSVAGILHSTNPQGGTKYCGNSERIGIH